MRAIDLNPSYSSAPFWACHEPQTQTLGRLFGVLKSTVQDWLAKHLSHGCHLRQLHPGSAPELRTRSSAMLQRHSLDHVVMLNVGRRQPHSHMASIPEPYALKRARSAGISEHYPPATGLLGRHWREGGKTKRPSNKLI